jgi:hypothetical protein
MLDMFVIDQPIISRMRTSSITALGEKLMSIVDVASVVTLRLVTDVVSAVSDGSSTVAKWNIQ